jgi:hypothetical protein
MPQWPYADGSWEGDIGESLIGPVGRLRLRLPLDKKWLNASYVRSGAVAVAVAVAVAIVLDKVPQMPQ